MSEDNLLPTAPRAEYAISRVGKRVNRVRGLKHGLRSTDKVYVSMLDNSERYLFARLRSQLIEEIQPAATLERMLVEHIAVTHFRLLRVFAIDHTITASALQPSAFHKGKPNVDEYDMKRLGKLAEYERQIERTFRLSWEQLRKLKEGRRITRQADNGQADSRQRETAGRNLLLSQ